VQAGEGRPHYHERDVVVDAEPAGGEAHRGRHQEQAEDDDQDLVDAAFHACRMIRRRSASFAAVRTA
jgi:hypothetical protein